MKKYLYEIDCNGSHEQLFPFMPRVLAEKTARFLNKEEQRRYGNLTVRYSASKTSLVTNDTSPCGLDAWFPLWNA